MWTTANTSSVLTATFTASLIATLGFAMVTVLGLLLVAADWRAGNGGAGFLAGAVGYQALLFALPIVGLVVMHRRRRLAVILQLAWVVAAMPLIWLVLRSAIPPH